MAYPEDPMTSGYGGIQLVQLRNDLYRDLGVSTPSAILSERVYITTLHNSEVGKSEWRAHGIRGPLGYYFGEKWSMQVKNHLGDVHCQRELLRGDQSTTTQGHGGNIPAESF